MDLLGPFVVGTNQSKYLIVTVDYKRNILAQFVISQVIVTGNGTQFIDHAFKEFVAKLGTTQHFDYVEHPQMNSQAKSANKVILRALKQRLYETKKRWA